MYADTKTINRPHKNHRATQNYKITPEFAKESKFWLTNSTNLAQSTNPMPKTYQPRRRRLRRNLTSGVPLPTSSIKPAGKRTLLLLLHYPSIASSVDYFHDVIIQIHHPLPRSSINCRRCLLRFFHLRQLSSWPITSQKRPFSPRQQQRLRRNLDGRLLYQIPLMCYQR